MSGPSGNSQSDSTGPPDRRTLRLLERHLRPELLVAKTAFDPDTYEPRVLRVLLDVDRYLESIVAARLDVRWCTTDDFSLQYVEEYDDRRWECRWDRHPDAHNRRLHFHQPPTAEEMTDLFLPSLYPLEVYSTVPTTTEQRLEVLWESQ